MHLIRRRLALVALALATLATPWAALAEDKIGDQEVSLGSPGAVVTVMEYASVTCPHCAHFNADVFPALKSKYIDTGKIRYVFREAPIHPTEDAAGFLLARCAGSQGYLAVTDALFRAQKLLFDKNDLHGWLVAGARPAGLNEDQMKACVTDAKVIEAFTARTERNMKADKIDSTPTVFVNGRRIEPPGQRAITIADLDAAIRPLLGGKSAAARKPVHNAIRDHRSL